MFEFGHRDFRVFAIKGWRVGGWPSPIFTIVVVIDLFSQLYS